MKKGQSNPWQNQLDDLLRAISGAYLFGIPMVITMETWWIGTYESMWKLAALLGAAFLINVMLVYFSGYRQKNILGNSFFQAVTTTALGILLAILVLFVLNRVAWGDPFDSVLGKVIVQTVPLSIGASVARSLISTGKQSRDSSGQQGQHQEPGYGFSLLKNIGATAVGGIFIGFSIAPTQEVPTIAASIQPVSELILLGFTLLITYIIVFESGFSPKRSRKSESSEMLGPLTQTMLAYSVSLLVAAISLILFQQIQLSDPIFSSLKQILVFGLPVAIGGAAGRLVL